MKDAHVDIFMTFYIILKDTSDRKIFEYHLYDPLTIQAAESQLGSVAWPVWLGRKNGSLRE